MRSRHLAYAVLRVAFRGQSLKAGEYRFEGPKTTEEVLRTLVEGRVVTYRVTIPEGLTADEIFGLVVRDGLATKAELDALFAQPGLFDGVPAGAPSLEGFLGPDTYVFTRSQGARGIVSTLVSSFRRSLPDRFEERARALGRTPLEAVTLASLVEKETAVAAERALVSAVYHNRLRVGMPLQCDPTTVYALRRRGLWTGTLTHDGLAVDDPYNTYVSGAFPPARSPARARRPSRRPWRRRTSRFSTSSRSATARESTASPSPTTSTSRTWPASGAPGPPRKPLPARPAEVDFSAPEVTSKAEQR